MIRQLMFLALAGASLGACDWGQSDPPPPPPRPNHERPSPIAEETVDWITPDPECRGSMRRGEWLACDNKHLRYLHRTLATEWAAARQGAERGALRVMRRQQEALLAERNRCGDAPCVETAYRRYLSGYARPETGPSWTPRPEPRPTWTPPPRRPVKYRPRPALQPREWNGGESRNEDWRSDRGRGEQSCAAELGGSASAYLVKQCRVVNGRWDRSCTADMACDDLREQIRDGCSSARRKPGFCNRR